LNNLHQILQGCYQRDPQQQKALYERYHHLALKIVFRYVYRYEEAIDLVNDGFVKFFIHIDRFRVNEEADTEKMLIGWLKRIMINTAIDYLRKKMLLPEIGGIPETVWDVPDKSANADQLLLYKDLITQVKKLPPAYRIVFNMYVLDGYSHAEIADALGIPIGSSKSSLSRARTLLQKYLQQMENQAACSI
jgi:RNA polymerase sigma factor (sigma-70 family)